MKKYFTIGTVVGTAVTVERLLRKREEIFEEAKGQDGWYALGAVLGLHWGNLLNVVTWPVALAYEVYELAQKK